MVDEYVVCDVVNCDLPATHTLVWTRQENCCAIHAQYTLRVADAMGFPTPANTVRELSADEMIKESGE